MLNGGDTRTYYPLPGVPCECADKALFFFGENPILQMYFFKQCFLPIQATFKRSALQTFLFSSGLIIEGKTTLNPQPLSIITMKFQLSTIYADIITTKYFFLFLKK